MTLPLLSNGNGLLIGEFNFEYRIIKPFKHKSCGSVLCKTFKNQERYTNSILIGHRGTGSHGSAALPGTRRTHIKENTVLAFNAAKSFGADFVEFDVQLTKDKVPIIYHDFLFPVGPFKIPINKITLDELQSFNKSASKRKNGKRSADTNDSNLSDDPSAPRAMPKASPRFNRTMSTPANLSSMDSQKRIKNMKQFDSFLEDDYRSLADIFTLAPKGLGFNIEIKYPVHAERIKDGIENTGVKLRILSFSWSVVFRAAAHVDLRSARLIPPISLKTNIFCISFSSPGQAASILKDDSSSSPRKLFS